MPMFHGFSGYKPLNQDCDVLVAINLKIRIVMF